MKRLLIVSLFFIFASIDIFAQSKPDSNAVFNYYVACATGDVKNARNFLIQYPDCVDIELSLDNFFGDNDKQISSEFAYQRFANYLISKGIAYGFKDKEEEERFIKNYKRYPILMASQYGHLDVVKLLISYHSNLELKDEHENTALIRASQNGHLDIIKELVNNGANIEDHQGEILAMAAYNGHKEVVEYFLKKGVNVDSKDLIGLTALMHASIANQLNIVKQLVKNGADVNAVNDSNFTSLMFASQQGNKTIAEFLIKNKANVNAKSYKGLSSLIIAASNGHSEIVSLLLKNKADVNAKSDEGVTALIAASANGYLNIVEELMKNKAVVNIKTNNGDTAMQAAIRKGKTEIVKLLMEYEADLLGDFTVLYSDIATALIKKHSDIACMILNDDRYRRMFFNSSIVPTFKVDGVEMTLLIYASREGFVDFTRLLIENNVNINEQNSNGHTALMFAAANNNVEIVRLLLDAGADANIKDNNGLKAMHYAAGKAQETGDTRVFNLLYTHTNTND